MNTTDEQAAQDYYTLLGTYIRELNKAHKGIRRLVRRNRKLEAAKQSIRVGQYEIAPSPQHGYVIQIVSSDGEGEAMGVKEAEFFSLIDRYYKENF